MERENVEEIPRTSGIVYPPLPVGYWFPLGYRWRETFSNRAAFEKKILGGEDG